MSPQRRPAARQLLTPQSERILATCYPGQVRAADMRAERKALREGEQA